MHIEKGAFSEDKYWEFGYFEVADTGDIGGGIAYWGVVVGEFADGQEYVFYEVGQVGDGAVLRGGLETPVLVVVKQGAAH